MKQRGNKPSIFHYRSYRRYLKDWYDSKKSANRHFSFRLFSKRAGLKSPNFLKLVMEDKRNLSKDGVENFIVGLELNKQESDFFRNLVLFNQSKDHEERDKHYKQLLKSKKLKQLKPIERDRYEYYSRWYNPIIRELVTSKEYDGKAESISGRISPRISPDDVDKSIQLLIRLKFIKMNAEGKYEQTEAIVTSGSEVESHTLFNYHLNMLDVSKKALQSIGSAKRDISSLTLSINRGKLPELKKMLQQFRREVLEFTSDDDSADDIIQLNIQMFSAINDDERNTK
ncbi:MAG: TIGR02147 family protein [Deltaproteobacteria bacterium]|nr:TIGR02147 family protein [Deltaproteobacteria bacterium]